MDAFDGDHLHPTLLQTVGEHCTEDWRRRGQHYLVRHKVDGFQVIVLHAERDVAQLPLQTQLVHDGEGCARVALQRVAEDAVAVARRRRHFRLALGHAGRRIHIHRRRPPGTCIVARQGKAGSGQKLGAKKKKRIKKARAKEQGSKGRANAPQHKRWS